MDVMRVMRWDEMDAAARAALCDRGLSTGITPELRAAIGELIEDVRMNGDDALCRALARFDGFDVEPDGLAVSEAEFAAAPAPEQPQAPAWQRAALLEGVSAKETIENLRGGSAWLS